MCNHNRKAEGREDRTRPENDSWECEDEDDERVPDPTTTCRFKSVHDDINTYL
jgi:hypothetical protein